MATDVLEKVETPEIEITEELRAEVLDRIIVARFGLLLRHPFFGNMATRLIIKEASDWCPTAATDGRHLFYSVPFFAKMTNKEIEFVCDSIIKLSQNHEEWALDYEYSSCNNEFIHKYLTDKSCKATSVDEWFNLD